MSRQKPLIYCVDDNDVNLTLLKKSLKDYDTLTFKTGEECLEKITEDQPDLVLMDVMMPGLDGVETCKRIKDNAATHDIPLIFLSAKFSIDDKLKGYAAGGDDYIGKPFDLEELMAKVNATLNRKDQLDASRDASREALRSSKEALSNLGETSVVLNFMQNALNCRTHDALAQTIIQAMSMLNLNVVMEIFNDGDWHEYSTTETENPFEKSVFEYVRPKGRLVSFGERTAVNYDNITIIVRNMPSRETSIYGRILDHIALIGKGAETKIQGIQQEKMVLQKFGTLIEFMEDMKSILANLDSKYEEHEVFTERVIFNMAEEMEQSFMQLGLTEVQEEDQRKIIEITERQIKDKNDEFSRVHRQFSSIHRQIDTVLEHTVQAMKQHEEEQAATEELVSLF